MPAIREGGRKGGAPIDARDTIANLHNTRNFAQTPETKHKKKYRFELPTKNNPEKYEKERTSTTQLTLLLFCTSAAWKHVVALARF